MNWLQQNHCSQERIKKPIAPQDDEPLLNRFMKSCLDFRTDGGQGHPEIVCFDHKSHLQDQSVPKIFNLISKTYSLMSGAVCNFSPMQ